MKRFKNVAAQFASDESGATAIEYGLIAALIGVGIITGATFMGGSIGGLFGDVDGDLTTGLGS